MLANLGRFLGLSQIAFMSLGAFLGSLLTVYGCFTFCQGESQQVDLAEVHLRDARPCAARTRARDSKAQGDASQAGTMADVHSRDARPGAAPTRARNSIAGRPSGPGINAPATGSGGGMGVTPSGAPFGRSA